MLNEDAFSEWMGIKIQNIDQKGCTLSVEVRDNMTNGFGIAHGGILFSLADTALAFAANHLGQIAKTVQAQISFFKPVYKNDVLHAVCTLTHQGHKLMHYNIEIVNQHKEQVAQFKGTVYKSSKTW